jgi:aspartyl/asparaginyl beta-hydroxylase (cupin superfamily)
MLFGTPFGFSFFSTLHGKSSIRAHSGPMNLRLRVHLPIMVPKQTASPNNNSDRDRPTTGIKIADQTREWHEGSALVLDDSYVHEVWNDAEEPRVLLLLDLWHPDVRMEEREKITNMFDYARGQGWIGKQKK